MSGARYLVRCGYLGKLGEKGTVRRLRFEIERVSDKGGGGGMRFHVECMREKKNEGEMFVCGLI